MKSNLLISCLVAVAIHTLLFILPLHKVGTSTASLVNAPMSLSIMPPKIPLSAAPPEPLPLVKEEPPLEETSVPRKESWPERQPVAIPVAETDFSQDETAKDDTKPPAGGTAVGTVLDPGDSPADLQQDFATLGNQQGKDVIVYARPRYKENPLPHYPKVARRRGYEGQTLLRVEVLKNGKVGQIKVMTSSGYKVLDKAALKSVKDWIFVPGTKGGVKIDQWVMVPVRFSLR
jgi:protein TonB